MISTGKCGKFLLVAALQILAMSLCQGLRLTNMSAPVLQDPRQNMSLHCSFDMGGEDLYAVKWYKDDHEFFRYTPSGSSDPSATSQNGQKTHHNNNNKNHNKNISNNNNNQNGTKNSITQFQVAGVTVVPEKTKCTRIGCDLLLTHLSRVESSGAYRCEVSSEAPAFRLASQTHNVTVAAVPEHPPKITGLQDLYRHSDHISANCSSGLGDPRPSITWFINEQQVQPHYVQEIATSARQSSELQNNSGIHLESTTSQLRIPIDKRLTKNRSDRVVLKISCTSSTDGISPLVSPPLTTTKVVIVSDQDRLVNNLKLHSPFSSSGSSGGSEKLVTLFSVILLIKL